MRAQNNYICNLNKQCSYKGLLFILLLCLAVVLKAQKNSALLTADSTSIEIGQHVHVSLKLNLDKGNLPSKLTVLGNMEQVMADTFTTQKSANGIIAEKKFVFSAYDSGNFVLGPAFMVFDSGDSLLTDSILIRCNTLNVDTTKPFKPIKAPLKVPYTWNEFLWIIIPVLFLIMLAIAGYVMWKEQQKKKPVAYTRPVPKDPPHIWAIKELKNLEDEKVWQKDEVKLYYSRLTEILRLYLEYRYRWFALEETTEEIEARIADYVSKDKAKEMLLEVLRAADLVKFAKVLPMPNNNIAAMETAVKFIEWTKPTEESKGAGN